MKYTLLFILLFSISLNAQTSYTGRVITPEEEAIVFASVEILNSDVSTFTDNNGYFELEYDGDSYTLAINSIGYQEKVIMVENGELPSIIVLKPRSRSLDEVVITALGIERDRQSIVSSVAKVDGEKLTTVPMTNIVNSLSGQVPGVQVTNGSSGVGSSSRITIRGENSLSGSNQPLFVVDGVPISNEQITSDLTNNGALQEVDYGNGGAEISPDDIESISILKGAGSAALYGARGANGVVLISTKRGKGIKGIGVSYNVSYTVETPLVLPDYQNRYGLGSNGKYAYQNGRGAGVGDGGLASFGPELDAGFMIPQFDSPSVDVNGNPVRGGDVLARTRPDGTYTDITPTPWVSRPDNVRDFFELGMTMQQNLALSSQYENGNMRISYSNLRNKGMLPNTDLKRDGVALSLDQYLTDKFSVNSYVNFINTRSKNRPNLGYGYENVMYGFTWTGRQTNIAAMRDYWQAGYEGKQHYDINYLWLTNPYLTLYENTNGFIKNRLLGNAAANYDFSNNLRLTLRTGVDVYNDLRTFKRAVSTNRNPFGSYREDNISFVEMNTDLLLSYKNKINRDWSYGVSAGANRSDQKSTYAYAEASQLAIGGTYTLANSQGPLKGNSEIFKKRINSVYGTGNVNYKKSIYLDLSIRNDWSSTLPLDNNSFAYYSIGMSYNVAKLHRLPKPLSHLNLRVSLASVGNDTRPYQIEQTYFLNESYNSLFRITNGNVLKNRLLRPERLNASEAGVEFWVFDDRLQFDVSVYRNVSIDQIISRPISSASGFKSFNENGGTVTTKGIEASVAGHIVRTRDFNWRATVNYSQYQSIVTALPDGVDQFVTGSARIFGGDGGANEIFYIAKEGGRVGDMYGTGFVEIDGQVLYNDNGLPVQDGKLRLLGNYNPDFMMGLGNEFSYKNLMLKVLVDWRQGGVLVSRFKAIASNAGILKETLPGREEGIIGEGIVNIGSEDNPEYVPNTKRISASQYYNNFYDRGNETSAMYDASYVKLRQVSLYYRFNDKLISRLKLQSLSVGLIGSNLLLFTENPHFDPELNALQERDITYGVEDASYPSSRSFGISIKTQF